MGRQTKASAGPSVMEVDKKAGGEDAPSDFEGDSGVSLSLDVQGAEAVSPPRPTQKRKQKVCIACLSFCGCIYSFFEQAAQLRSQLLVWCWPDDTHMNSLLESCLETDRHWHLRGFYKKTDPACHLSTGVIYTLIFRPPHCFS
jgi:hypothetical protein